MDTQSLMYFVEASHEMNFTQTAKRLYISQQNLSNHIARLEEYFGVPLFDRKPRLTLTVYGEELLTYAERFFMQEDNLKTHFANLQSQSTGVLHIGCSPSRSSVIVSELVVRLLERYPNVKIHLHQHHSKALAEQVLSGALNFSISVPQAHRANLLVTPLFQDHIILLVRTSVLKRCFGSAAEEMLYRFQKGAKISEFAQLPLLSFRDSKLIEVCYQQEGYTPNFAITSNYPSLTTLNTYLDRVVAIISYGHYLHVRRQLSGDVYAFPVVVNGSYVYHQIAFIRHRQKYMPPYGEYFLQLTEQYFHDLQEQ